MSKNKTLVVTCCGARKNSIPMVAYKLYKSSRIRAVYNRRYGCDMAILSAKYGLIDAHETIEPYDMRMDENRSKELESTISKKLRGYERVVFFAGGSGKYYRECLRNACEATKMDLITIGYANLGDINKLSETIEKAKKI